jgi:hypothetical protein
MASICSSRFLWGRPNRAERAAGSGSGFGDEGADQGDLGGEFVGPGEGNVETGLTAPLISAEGRSISDCSSTGARALLPASLEVGSDTRDAASGSRPRFSSAARS